MHRDGSMRMSSELEQNNRSTYSNSLTECVDAELISIEANYCHADFGSHMASSILTHHGRGLNVCFLPSAHNL